VRRLPAIIAKGFSQNFAAARSGGSIAGQARKQLEKETGESVVTKENNLKPLPPSHDLLQLPECYDESLRILKTAKKTR
ncbi:MAG: hypothetical protein ABSF51_03180, partial [Verrucomicrobiota bacterium]